MGPPSTMSRWRSRWCLVLADANCFDSERAARQRPEQFGLRLGKIEPMHPVQWLQYDDLAVVIGFHILARFGGQHGKGRSFFSFRLPPKSGDRHEGRIVE